MGVVESLLQAAAIGWIIAVSLLPTLHNAVSLSSGVCKALNHAV